LASLPRAGIIHRLDKDTSGLLVVARTPEAHTSLTRQLMARSVAREYLAVCVGVMTSGGTVDEPIGRHRSDRLRMTVRQDGRPAVTHYRVLERFRAHTYLNVKLETGRTHQIRLHLSHLRYPIAGDQVYGGRFAQPKGATERLRVTLSAFKRQALHAASLAFDHPRSGKRLCRARCLGTTATCSPLCARMRARPSGLRQAVDEGFRCGPAGTTVADTGLAGARRRARAVDAARRRGE
jgi:23S rRNA pseudouridine1911/1915/1917 synthase